MYVAPKLAPRSKSIRNLTVKMNSQVHGNGWTSTASSIMHPPQTTAIARMTCKCVQRFSSNTDCSKSA